MAKGVIKIDIDKAKDVYKDMLRSARKPVLEDLDLQFMRAVETGNATLQTEIAAKKQALRDVTNDPKIDKVKKAEDFRKIFPDVLKPNVEPPLNASIPEPFVEE